MVYNHSLVWIDREKWRVFHNASFCLINKFLMLGTFKDIVMTLLTILEFWVILVLKKKKIQLLQTSLNRVFLVHSSFSDPKLDTVCKQRYILESISIFYANDCNDLNSNPWILTPQPQSVITKPRAQSNKLKLELYYNWKNNGILIFVPYIIFQMITKTVIETS